jgi:hypothetical protein
MALGNVSRFLPLESSTQKIHVEVRSKVVNDREEHKPRLSLPIYHSDDSSVDQPLVIGGKLYVNDRGRRRKACADELPSRQRRADIGFQARPTIATINAALG